MKFKILNSKSTRHHYFANNLIEIRRVSLELDHYTALNRKLLYIAGNLRSWIFSSAERLKCPHIIIIARFRFQDWPVVTAFPPRDLVSCMFPGIEGNLDKQATLGKNFCKHSVSNKLSRLQQIPTSCICRASCYPSGNVKWAPSRTKGVLDHAHGVVSGCRKADKTQDDGQLSGQLASG